MKRRSRLLINVWKVEKTFHHIFPHKENCWKGSGNLGKTVRRILINCPAGTPTFPEKEPHCIQNKVLNPLERPSSCFYLKVRNWSWIKIYVIMILVWESLKYVRVPRQYLEKFSNNVIISKIFRYFIFLEAAFLSKSSISTLLTVRRGVPISIWARFATCFFTKFLRRPII